VKYRADKVWRAKVWDEMWDVGGNVDLSLKVQGLSLNQIQHGTNC
jgi:hypothetical protein